MKALLIAQGIVLFCVCAFFSLWGISAVVSAFMGGVSYWIPSILATLLFYQLHSKQVIGSISFIWAESIKITLSMILMLLFATQYSSLRWGFFLIGFASVASSVFLVIRKMDYYVK